MEPKICLVTCNAHRFVDKRVMKFDCVKRYGEMSKLYNEFGWDDNTTWCDSRIVFLKREK